MMKWFPRNPIVPQTSTLIELIRASHATLLVNGFDRFHFQPE